MRFEPNKFYKHTCGHTIHTTEIVNTTMWGETLIAESSTKRGHDLIAVGIDNDSYAEYWVEITEEEWMTDFSPNSSSNRKIQ